MSAAEGRTPYASFLALITSSAVRKMTMDTTFLVQNCSKSSLIPTSRPTARFVHRPLFTLRRVFFLCRTSGASSLYQNECLYASETYHSVRASY